MKSSVFASLALAAVATSVFAGLDSVDEAIRLSNVSFTQELATRDVVVNYTLAGTNAIIRADVLTNGVSIGKSYLKTVTGDYSATLSDTIAPGRHSFRWKACKDWPDQLAGDLQVKLCALYPEEAGRPETYDAFARTVYANDFTSTSVADWTTQFSGQGSFLAVQSNVLVMRNSSSAAPNTTSVINTPAFEGLETWRISFDFGVYCANSIDWDQYWTRWGYSISGLDTDGNEVFKLTGTASGRGAAVNSTVGGVTVAGTTTGANTRLTLLRTAPDTFSVFGPNGVVGTTTAPIAKSDAKITKLRFVIPTPSGSPAVCMYGYIDNLRIEDISSAPF